MNNEGKIEEERGMKLVEQAIKFFHSIESEDYETVCVCYSCILTICGFHEVSVEEFIKNNEEFQQKYKEIMESKKPKL